MRQITYAQAINEAIDQSMARDKNVIIIGEGVPDPKGIFGTTLGLQKKYGQNRVFDMPVSENGVTGICVGAAISGMKVIMTHQRIDFALLSMDQIVNNAAKWFYMFGGQKNVSLVIKMIIGKGWGQGSQHSQSLQASFGHIPGLKVVMPSTAHDAKGMMIGAINDGNPVIFIEHRWLHNIKGFVNPNYYIEDVSTGRVVKKGKDITVAASSYMNVDTLKASEVLRKAGVSVEHIDIRSIKPWDKNLIVKSVEKTGRLLVADTGYKTLGFASEVIAGVSENTYQHFKTAPRKITLPDIPTPTSWKLAEKYYPTYSDIIKAVLEMMEFPETKIREIIGKNRPDPSIKSDVPDANFKGPF